VMGPLSRRVRCTQRILGCKVMMKAQPYGIQGFIGAEPGKGLARTLKFAGADQRLLS
jgi:hypothetical protein